jgi:hypothetical protein
MYEMNLGTDFTDFTDFLLLDATGGPGREPKGLYL